VQPLLALDQRQAAQILAPGEHRVEDEEHHVLRAAFRQGDLQGGEIRCAVLVQRAGFAVYHAVRQLPGDVRDRLELCRPVETLARLECRLAAGDAQLQAIAIELDLVHPARRRRRLIDQLGELRLDEGRDGADLLRLGLGLRRHRRPAAALLVALPDRAGGALPRGHERRRCLAGADGDLLQGAARRDRGVVLLQQGIVVAFVRGVIPMLD